MHLEIQEAVNFIARFLFDKIPRRKVCLFVEQLANFLALKFHDHWFVDEPHKEMTFRALHVNVRGVSEPLLGVAASSVGLDREEIMQFLASELTIWINPGMVCYRVGEHGMTRTVFDASQQHSGAKLNAANGPAGDSSPNYLKLNLHASDSSNWVINHESGGTVPPVFELSSPHDLKFTVGSFALTRFGTSKQKTNLTILKDIQRKAALKAIIPGLPSNYSAMTSGVSFSPSQSLLHQQVLHGHFPRMSPRGTIF
uniref:Anti-proliferative protein domain-containing protein n=1 Tax=Plectus sambesii TaxID=2011161 RepID=A0A914UTT7_9BILA